MKTSGSNRRMAKSSLKDEKDAIRIYSRQKQAATGGLKKVIAKNLRQEKQHAAGLKPYAKAKTP